MGQARHRLADVVSGMTSPWRERVEIAGGRAVLYLGDCREIVPTLQPFDCLLTDPPYSSGGAFRGDRAQPVATKYVQTTSEWTSRADFAGETRDQRAFLAWASMVFSDAYAVAAPGATCMVFSDWRQLPTMTDAVQCGGWVWRNLVTWWKPGIRMQRGRFSSSAEYLVYGSKGPVAEGAGSPQNVIRCAPVGGEEKQHIAEKPVSLLRQLLEVTPPTALVLDPFAGSGTTAAACLAAGRRFVGIELDPAHFATACRRIAEAARQPDLLIPETAA